MSNITPRGNASDHEYDGYLARLRARFVQAEGLPLFTTDAANDGLLWQDYLEGFSSPEEQQYHNCSCCRHFIERYGGLVTIDEKGIAHSVIWDEDDAPPAYKTSVTAMRRRVCRAQVTGVFFTDKEVLGTPVTGQWTHLHVKLTGTQRMAMRPHLAKTSGQSAAVKREEFGIVQRALARYALPMVDQALRLLESETMYRAEKVIGPARWLRKLHVDTDARPNPYKKNLVWLAVATAPAGFCHPTSSMIGTLLEDIAEGMDFDSVSKRFAAKMHPLQYQRPTSAPAEQTIAQAEKLVQEMGIASALRRRFATLADITEFKWQPQPEAPAPEGEGVFGHLRKQKDRPDPLTLSTVRITWAKFERMVLPVATSMRVPLPGRGMYSQLVTAVDPQAKPILQWDREDQRNPVSWYLYHNGSTPETFGLESGALTPVLGVCLQPNMWHGDKFPHQGKGVMFLLAGAKDQRATSLALFPEILKSELHPVRSVIEAHSMRSQLEFDQTKEDSPVAAGLLCQASVDNWNLPVQVTMPGSGNVHQYLLERWD